MKTTVAHSEFPRHLGSWVAFVGWSAHKNGWRLRRAPDRRRSDRVRQITIEHPPNVLPCTARYALILGAAVLAGRAVAPTGPCTEYVTVRLPAKWADLDELAARVTAGLELLDPIRPLPAETGQHARTMKLGPEARRRIEQLGGCRTYWIRQALAALENRQRQ